MYLQALISSETFELCAAILDEFREAGTARVPSAGCETAEDGRGWLEAEDVLCQPLLSGLPLLRDQTVPAESPAGPGLLPV